MFMCTDIYPSNLEDWQPIESIVGIFDAFHAFIGEHLYKVRSARSLAERGVFFYDKFYTAPQSATGYGSLKPLSSHCLLWIVQNGQYLLVKQVSALD